MISNSGKQFREANTSSRSTSATKASNNGEMLLYMDYKYGMSGLMQMRAAFLLCPHEMF